MHDNIGACLGSTRCNVFGRRDVDDNFYSAKVASSLLTDIHSVRNSAHYLNKESTKFYDYPKLLWQLLQTSYKEQPSRKNGDEGTELREILTEGKNLHRMADSLHAPVDPDTVTGVWKGSLLKRCLIGIGILSGGVVVGDTVYRYYAGKQASAAGPMGNATQLGMPLQSSGGTLENSFGDHLLPHHDDTGNRARHTLRDVSGDATLSSKNTSLSMKKDVCSTQAMYTKCQTAHQNAAKKGIYFNRLVLNVGKKPCICPKAEAIIREENSPANAEWGHNNAFLTGFDPSGQSDNKPRTTRKPPADFFWGNNVGILTGYDASLHKK